MWEGYSFWECAFALRVEGFFRHTHGSSHNRRLRRPSDWLQTQGWTRWPGTPAAGRRPPMPGWRPGIPGGVQPMSGCCRLWSHGCRWQNFSSPARSTGSWRCEGPCCGSCDHSAHGISDKTAETSCVLEGRTRQSIRKQQFLSELLRNKLHWTNHLNQCVKINTFIISKE